MSRDKRRLYGVRVITPLGITDSGAQSVLSVDRCRRIPPQLVVPVNALDTAQAADDLAGGVAFGDPDAVPVCLADVGG